MEYHNYARIFNRFKKKKKKKIHIYNKKKIKALKEFRLLEHINAAIE